MKNITQMATTVLVLSLLGAACAKKRDAALPSTDAPKVFAISEFGTLDPDQSRTIVRTHSQQIRAENTTPLAREEKGLVAVDADSRVPARLAFMFRGLTITGKAQEDVRIVFAVDRNNVTAYKVVSNLNDISQLEQQRVTSAEEVRAEINLQKSLNADEQMTARSFHDKARETLKAACTKGEGRFLVKLFSYKVESMGILRRSKNDLGEETTKLELAPTEFAEATHVKITNDASARQTIAGDDDVFVTKMLDGKVMPAGRLKDEFGVSTGLEDGTLVVIRFDANGGMVISELATKESLGGKKTDDVTACDAEFVRNSGLTKISADNCVVIPRFRHAVKFVQANDGTLKFEDNRSKRDELVEAGPGVRGGLVRIPRNHKKAIDKSQDGKAEAGAK